MLSPTLLTAWEIFEVTLYFWKVEILKKRKKVLGNYPSFTIISSLHGPPAVIPTRSKGQWIVIFRYLTHHEIRN